MKLTEEFVITRWCGEDKAKYYQELEDFYKRHESAELKSYHSDSGVLISVTYIFKPTQVAMEHIELMEKLAEEARGINETD
jgi:hypothetical protein